MQTDNSEERRKALDQLATCKSAMSRRIHELNNLLTAFHCIWDGAANQMAKSPTLASDAKDLEVVIEQLTTQFRALQQDFRHLISHVESELSISGTAGESSIVSHRDELTQSASRASDSGPLLKHTSRDLS